MVGGAQFELLTPPGHGGVAVVAVFGDRRWEHIAELCVDASGQPAQPVGGVQLVTLYLEGAATDQILLVDRPADACVELHLHGSPAVVLSLQAAVGGFRERASGDPRQRVLEVARSRAQLALCLEQAALDFGDELAGVVGEAAPLRAMLRRSEVARAQLEPCRLVICGAQNAGKSTLMNRLLFQERVLTGDLPGLTRDPVRELAVLSGYPYELVDTAGEGVVGTAIDRQALERGRQERRGALRLLVVDGARGPTGADRQMRDAATLVVQSKADLPAADWPADFPVDLRVSCRYPLAAAEVRTRLGDRLLSWRDLPPAGPVGGGAALADSEWERLRAAVAELPPPPV